MQLPWIRRSFDFTQPVEHIGVLCSRLRGAATRIRHAVVGLGPRALTERRDGAWSIQEHVGHLRDLDALHLLRLDELARGAATLAAADMTNRATWDADWNARPFAAVLTAFAERRAQLLARLGALDATGLARAALHPRLQQPMRAVDVASFAADHDDHHLARLEALAGTVAPAPAPATVARWSTLPHDEPLPLVERRRIVGSEAMISHFTLHRGCVVPPHAHHNEQFSCVLSGKVRFRLADGDRVVEAGEVLHLPSHASHGAEAIETAVVLDVFAPPSANTGVDTRR